MSAILGITRSSAYNLARAGILPHVAFRSKGNRDTIRFRQQDVDAFISGHLRVAPGAGR